MPRVTVEGGNIVVGDDRGRSFQSIESVTFAVPLEGSRPTVTALPTGGKGVALDASGNLPTSAPATALPRRTADPDQPQPGMVWLRTDLAEIRFRNEDGVTYKLEGVSV